MNINNLRIKYEISQNALWEITSIREKVIRELRKQHYRITEETGHGIMFDNSGPPKFEVRGASASKLQTGIFEFTEAENRVKLTYFVSYKYMLLALSLILLLACFFSLIMLVLGLFLIITFGIELVSQRTNAQELIERIFEADD